MVGYIRKKDNRRGIRFTLLVTGPQGTGKTSFVNSLLDQNILPHRYQNNSSNDHGKTIPKTITFSNLSTLNASQMEHQFDASISHHEPGIAITETSVEIIDEDDTKILLTVIDTPGFGDNFDNNICINEICNFLEQQFDYVLAEETKVRRNPRFEDTRVHACLYFIEPTGHGLRELDVQTMSKISKYVNIIPIIGRADSFTKNELINFKRNILQDIERFKIPVFQFQADESETDPDIIEESRYLSQLQPFAIITSDIESTIDNKKTRIRKYPWGVIDINDTNVSDFPILKSVILGSQLQELKDITHDFLYEAYRTEKLSSVTDLKNDFTDSVNIGISSSEPPSMSNLAEIAKSKSMAKFDLPKRQVKQLSNDLSNLTIEESNSENNNQDNDESRKNSNDDDDDDDGVNNNNNTEMIDDDTSKAIKRQSVDSSISNISQSTFAKPQIANSSNSSNSPQLSVNSNNGTFIGNFQVPQSQIDTKKLRKISETVPYILRQETLRSKQAKLEELERQSALELTKRAAELERKAKELKLREAMLRERVKQQQNQSQEEFHSQLQTEDTNLRESNVSLGTHESQFVDVTSEDQE
jgi:septin 1 family protein